MSLETICFLLLFCTRFFICIFIFFYLYTFILEKLGILLKSLWNSHCVVNIAWHATPLTTWRTRRSKIWNFRFILFPIYLCPVSSLIKIKRQRLKQNNWKYLRDLTRTRVTQISRISWIRHLLVNCCFFFYREGKSFFLHGHQYNCTKAVRIGKTNHHLFSTSSWEGLNFPPLPKLGHIRWPSYVKGYSFLDGSLLGQRTYSVEKKMSLAREEPQVMFAILAKEPFVGVCANLVVCQ